MGIGGGGGQVEGVMCCVMQKEALKKFLSEIADPVEINFLEGKA